MMKSLLLAAVLAAFSCNAFAQQTFGGGPSSGTGYPSGSLPITASTTGTTGALSVTLGASSAQTTYICGYLVTSGGTTTALAVAGTITGTISGTLNFTYIFASSGQGLLGVAFPICIPANNTNTAIVVNVPGGGTATVASLFAWGYRF
jgi:hypothetical protein